MNVAGVELRGNKLRVNPSIDVQATIGMNVAGVELRGNKLRVNPSIDVNETTAIVFDAKLHKRKTGRPLALFDVRLHARHDRIARHCTEGGGPFIMSTGTWVEQLLNAMVATDRLGAAAMVERILLEGMAPDRVITEVLEPALVRVGILWGKEAVSLAQTFVAAKIAEDVLLRCMPEAGAVVSHKKPAVIGNIEDDFHSLGRRIVATFLRAAGWEVYDLGNDVPAAQFVDKAIEVGAVVVGASAMMQTTALNIRRIRALIDVRGLQDRLKLAVGGAVFTWRPELVAEVGGNGMASSAADADALFRRLHTEVTGAPLR